MNPILTYDPGDGRTILREGRGGSLVKLSDYEALEKRLAVVQAELEAAFPDPAETRKALLEAEEKADAELERVFGSTAEVITIDESPTLTEEMLKSKIQASIRNESP